MKIIAALIVKNEEELLARCLDSIKGVDAIYISDTGSEDKTIEIAKKYTDKVWTEDLWHDSFCDARNFILNKIKAEVQEDAWILSIDADEYLIDFSKIKPAIELAESRGLLAMDVKLISEVEKQEHFYPRLFKKSPQVWWEGVAHNHISVKAGGTSEVQIIYGYSPAHLKNPHRTLNILIKEVEKTGNARETFYLGREYWYRGMYRECVETMGTYVQKAHFLPEKADAFLIMARCYWLMGMPNDARDACAQALIINSHFKEAILFMAKLAGRGTGNPTWEKNAQQWEKLAETADNSMVLFVRNDK